jgi:ABC-2 type transport system ATP-binding protein
MRQRLGIARALVNDPQVVFFDEPTLGLDPAGQRKVLGLVSAVARERGATVVLSTHFLGEVEDTCSSVVILNRGRVIADGTVAEVTRLAAAPRRGRFRVPAELRDRALEVLAGVPELGDAKPLDGRPDWVALTLEQPDVGHGPTQGGAGAQPGVAEAVRALTEAGIPLLAFELEGARLSDAFLSMTGEEL